MAVFISNAITDRGRILLGEAQVGATLEATKIVMGSGYIPSGSTAATMTAVVAPVIELEINKKKRAGDGTVTFGGAFSNETITEAFYFREFALFARVQYADGTYSDEALYSYGNAGGNADLIPAYSTSTVVEKQMDIVVYVGNETQVNLTVASGLYNAHAEKHAADGEDPITPVAIGAMDRYHARIHGSAHDDIPAGKYYAMGMSDLPPTASSTYGYLDVDAISDDEPYRRLRFTPFDSAVTFEQVFDGESWTEWVEIATADKFLPLTGGTVNGPVNVLGTVTSSGFVLRYAGNPIYSFYTDGSGRAKIAANGETFVVLDSGNISQFMTATATLVE